MVAWHELSTEEVQDSIKSIEVSADSYLDMIPQNDDFIYPCFQGDISVDFDVRSLLRPLGDIWRVLHKEERTDLLKETLETYWKYKGVPKIRMDVIKNPDAPSGWSMLSGDITHEDVHRNKLDDMLSQVVTKDLAATYGKFRIGADGVKTELQFLSEDLVAEPEEQDILNAGLFVSVQKNRVWAAPGVHRLVCSNGLISSISNIEGNNLDFVRDKGMLSDAAKLMKWFVSQRDTKVATVRELSACFGNRTFPQNIVTKKWKSWSERIELGELSYYDVINDLTSQVNNTLASTRYSVISVPKNIQRVQDKCNCPTCSAKLLMV